jgi:hypothetical protein
MSVNWEAAGAIGEIVGAAAVVLTLLYLAAETRKNAQALDATTTREFGFRLSEWAREVARDPELKRISLKSLKPELEEFSEAEWHEFRIFAHSLFFIYQTSFSHMSLGLGNREESENYLRLARGLIDGFPAWRKFWEEETPSGSFTSGFIAAVDSVPRASEVSHFAGTTVRR